MKGKTILTLVVVGSLMIVGAVAPVAAHNSGNDVGVSGHCSNDNGGGGGSVGVSQDGSVDATDPAEIQSVVNALVFFFQQKQDNPNREDTCDGGNGEDSYDYLEAHAGNGEQQIQACYSEDNADQNGGVGQGDQCHN